MKAFNKAVISLIALTVVSANAADIKSNSADRYIRVTKQGDLRSFQLCSKSGSSCSPLGSRNWYKVSALESQRTREQWQAAGSTVGAAAATVLALAGGWLAASVIGGGTLAVGGGTLLAEGVGVSGATIGTGVLASFAKVGPVEQFKQQYLLRSEVINDEEVNLDGKDDRDIQEIAVRLEELLRKLD